MISKDKLSTLTEDELALFWGIINLRGLVIFPANLSSCRLDVLERTFQEARSSIKDEFVGVLDSLINKLASK